MGIDTRQSDTETTRAVVEAAYKAGDKGDFPAFAALLADDIVVEEAAGHPCPGWYRGKAEVVPALGKILGAVGMRSIRVKDMVVEGALAIALIDLECTDSAGQSFIMPVAEAWWVRDGRVTEIRPYYYDTATLSARCKK